MTQKTKKAEINAKLRELNIVEDMQVRHGVEHARMAGVLRVPKHLVEHALAQLPEGWDGKVEEEGR